MAKSCTYTFAGPDDKEVTITGAAAFKAYLAKDGLKQFYPDGQRPQGDATPTQASDKPEAKAKIEDSGEVLEGARKLYAKSYAAKLDEGTGMETASVPLAKSWPEPDYQRLIDEGADPWATALARAMRDEIPTKPVKAWKLKGWVAKVEGLRDMAQRVMNGSMTKERFTEEAGKFRLDDWLNKVDLYEAVGHANSLKGMKFAEHSYSFFAGQKFDPPKKLWTVNAPSTSASATWSNGNWGNDLVVADSKAEAIAKFKAWATEQAAKSEDGQGKPAGKRTEFHVYRYRNKPTVWIVGKRISATKSIDLMEFETSKEAQAFITANQDKLETMLTEAKAEQSERREENAPRVGADHRNGGDVTTEQFRETFGFRGEQFGASMPQAERQANMNQAYDALMDLAGVIGVPPKALSLNGELGLAFGARGRGGKNPAMAHYEADTTGAVTPNRVVINLTRKNGAGSLAHEFFHAVDNYFARMRGEKAGFLTESYPAKRDGVRPEMVEAFKKVMSAITMSGIRERSKSLDKQRTKDYWSTGVEMAARSFESYVIAKLQDKSGANDYLANILPESAWLREGSYPYPTMGEMPAIRAAFDNFFETVKTKETDKGVAVYERLPAYGNDAEGFTSAPTVNENTGSYETDLFGNPLPTAAKRTGAAKPAAPRVRGDAQPAGVIQDTPAPAGEYLVKTTIGSEVNRKMGTDTVFTAKDLAVATSYLYKSAVERFDGVVTDKDGKILGVVGGFKGAVTQTAIYPGTVMGEAIRIPGAARIWFSHNHPSGKSALSREDVNLWNTFKTTFDGTGIEPMGLIAVGGGEFSYTGQALYAPPGKDGEQFAPIPQAKGEFTVPVMERALPIGRQSLPPAIATPSDAKSVAKTMFERAGRRPGMMMLNAQNVPIGWVPIGGLLRGNLRNTGGMNALFRAASESNMSAAILVHDGDLDAKVSNAGGGVTVGQNIGAALAMVDVRILDILRAVPETYSDGSKGLYFRSNAESGMSTSAGPVFRSDRTQATAPAKGISAKEAQDAVNKTLAGLGLDGVVSVNVGNNPGVFGFTTAPGVMPSGGSSGGKIYVFTDNISDVTDVFNVVLHELFHMGLSQSVGQGEYIQTMLKFLADPAVRRYAERWKLSTDGQTRKGKMLANNWNALAVEEAMADIAEDMGTDRIGTKQKSEFVRNMIRILANLAQKLKMPGVARKLRQMTYTESEKFVQDMMARARDGAPVLSNSDALSSSREAVGLAAATVTREASTFSEAREQVKTFQGKSLINKRTGMEAVVSRNTLDKMLSSKAVGKSESAASHSFAVANLDQLFERAILGWSKPDSAGDSNIAAIHRFFAPIMRDGRLQMVKMTVKETSQKDKANPLYTVETVEFNEKSPAAQWVGEIANADGIDPRTIRSAGEAQSLAEKIEAFNNDGIDFVWRSQRSTDEAMEFTLDGRADAESLINLAKAKDAAGLKKQVDGKFSKLGKFLNDGFHDAMGPAKRWIEGLQAGDSAKRALLSGLYRGAVQRDALQFDAKQKHGNKILEGISKIAKANGLDAETAQKLVGYWLTANYAPKANDWLLTKDRAALKVAKESGDDTAIAVAEQKIKDRMAAINDRNVRNVKRTAGVAGGLNNAQAALMKANIEKRMPADQIEAVAKDVYALLQWKKELDLKTGKVTPEQVKAWPGHADYVPLTGSPFVSLDEDVFGTGTNLPNVSKDKAIDGRTDSVADDGISAVWREVSKSATHAGFQDFKQALNGVYEDTLASNNGDKRATAEELGMTRSDSEYQASPGDDVVIYRSGGTSKVFRFEDQAVIQAIKKGNVEETNKLVAMAGYPTRIFAQLATMWNVTFAPMNMTRDVWEKSELLRTRDLVDAKGGKLDTDAVARKMISLAFAPGVWKASYRAVRGKADMSNPFDKALHELQINGGISTWGDHFAKKRGDLVGEVEESTSKLAKVRGAVEAYNGVFEMVSSLASYMAMKEAGTDTKEAAYQSLDLMNFRKQGAHMGPLRAAYAFSQPIVTGGANLAGALKTRKGQVRLAAYMVIGGLTYAALRGMADDDEAGNKLDNAGAILLDRSIPVPFFGGILKIPVGFGMPQLAWSWAVNGVKMFAGEQSPGDTATELLVRNTFKLFSPIQPTEISASKDTAAFLMTSAMPTMLKPVMQVALDKTAFGSPITPKFYSNDIFKSVQGRDQTAQFYKDVAIAIREIFGKDMFPEQVKVLVDGFAIGPLRTALQVAVTNPNKERLGKATDIPILSALYQEFNESVKRTKFFAALEEAQLLNKERSSGKEDFSEEEQKKLEWKAEWEKEAKEFTKRKAAITRRKLDPETDEAEKNVIAKEREAAEAKFLFRWRVIEGKTTKAPQGAF